MKIDIKHNEIIQICIKCGEIHQIKEDDLEGRNYVSPTFISNCSEKARNSISYNSSECSK